MKCNICNATLTDKEISFHPMTGALEPCTVCLDIAYDAAFPGMRGEDGEIELLDDGSEDILNG